MHAVRELFAALLCAVLLGCIQPSSEAPPPGPWIAAAMVARDTERDIQTSDIPGIKDHVPALEEVLAEGAIAFPPPPTADGAAILLTDGAAETNAAVAAAGTARVRVVDNPYPRIAFYLASYYDNNGKPADALRVLALGFKLTSGTAISAEPARSRQRTRFRAGDSQALVEGLQTCQAGLALPQRTGRIAPSSITAPAIASPN